MTVSKILFYSSISFVFGIFLSSFFSFPIIPLILLLIFGLFFITIPPFSQKRKAVIAGFFILFFVFGAFRYSHEENKFLTDKLSHYNETEEIVLTGVINQDPDIRENSIKLFVVVEGVDEKSVKGNVLITTSRYPEYSYGDKLRIIGKLQTPPVFNDFNYQNYLKKDGIYSVMGFPEIELIDSDLGNPIMASLFNFK